MPKVEAPGHPPPLSDAFVKPRFQIQSADPAIAADNSIHSLFGSRFWTMNVINNLAQISASEWNFNGRFG